MDEDQNKVKAKPGNIIVNVHEGGTFNQTNVYGDYIEGDKVMGNKVVSARGGESWERDRKSLALLAAAREDGELLLSANAYWWAAKKVMMDYGREWAKGNAQFVDALVAMDIVDASVRDKLMESIKKAPGQYSALVKTPASMWKPEGMPEGPLRRVAIVGQRLIAFMQEA